MNFEDEDYRRLYVRRTVTNRKLGWEGRAVMHEMLYEFDRAGIWEFTEDPTEDICELVGLPLAVVKRGLLRLLVGGTWIRADHKLVWPSFVEAQTCAKSDRIRQQESRDRRRAEALSEKKTSQIDQSRHEPSQPSQSVTLSLSEPSLSEPNRAREDARAPEVPEVPGLQIVSPPASGVTIPLPAVPHDGPLRPSRWDQAPPVLQPLHRTLRFEYEPTWSPTKANQARGHELGLTDEEIWARWESVREKPYPRGFWDDQKQFNRELAWAAQDKTTKTFKTRAERDAFEMPGKERRA